MRRRPLLLLPIVALLCASAPIPAQAAPPGVDPSAVNLTLHPGESATITKTVTTATIPPNPDIVFLADTTGSMGVALQNVKDNATSIINTVRAVQPSAEFGVASYQDENPPPPATPTSDYLFRIEKRISDTITTPQAAIGTWATRPGLGGDTPEGTINALFQLTTDQMGYRPDDTKIVAWFGDASSHDPSNGHTLAEVKTALHDAGIRVVAVDLGDGTAGRPGLEGPGVPGQATQIVQATNGALLQAADDRVAAQILAGIQQVQSIVTHRVTSCDPLLTVTNAPDSRTVASGQATTFTETVTVANSAPPGTYHCAVDYLVGGVSAGFVENISVTVPNIPPTVSPGGPYTGLEDNDVAILGTVTDPDTPNPTTTWSIEELPGSHCTFGNANALSTTVNCTERGTYRLTLTADDHANPPVSVSTTVTLRNVPPTVSAGGPYNGNEDNDIAIVGTVTDPDGPAPTVTWSFEPGTDVPAGAKCTFGDPNALATTVNCTDHGTYTLTLTVDDHANPPVSATATLTLANVKPTVSAGGPYIGEEDHPVTIVGTVTDPDSPGLTSTWTIERGPGVDPAAICSFTDPAKLSTVVTCSEPGTYTLTLTVDDKVNPPVVVKTTVTLSQTLGALSMITSVEPLTGFVGGDPVVVTHTVHNAGPAVMKGVQLTTTIPGGLQPADVSLVGCAATCELGTLAPGQTVQVRITFATNAPADQVVSAVVTTAGPDVDPTDNGGSVRVLIRKPTLTVDPGAGPQGFVPHVTGTDFPPGARIQLRWAIGISETPGEWVVGGDGRLDAWALVFPKDMRGSRTLLANSVAGQKFGPVESTPFLVLPRPLQPMDFVIR